MSDCVRHTPFNYGKVVAYGLEIIVDKDGYKRAYVEPIRSGEELMEALARDNRTKEYWVYEKKSDAKAQAKITNDMADWLRKKRKEEEQNA